GGFRQPQRGGWSMDAKAFERIVTGRMREALKPLSFRKRGNTFVADFPEAVLLVQLQKSTRSTRERMVATVNLGVFSRALADQLGWRGGAPTEPECHWRERIGYLAPIPGDIWWDVGSEGAALSAAEQIVELL